jgi:hypothetical protein
MSTYVRALSPAKTEAGSDASLFIERLRTLWGGGRKQSGLNSFAIPPLCVYVIVCARVSVCQCYTMVCLPKKQHGNRAHASKDTDKSNAKNMHLKLRAYTSYGKVQKHTSML